MTTPADLERDLAAITRQERDLQLRSFDPEAAWQLGNLVRRLAIERNHSIVIDIRRFGSPFQPLFYTAMPGTTPDNYRWVERKANTVARFHRSSYAMGFRLQIAGVTFAEKYNLPEGDYATHGGSFPLIVSGTGVVGSLTVSGLAQHEDHELVVKAICLFTERDPADYRLPS